MTTDVMLALLLLLLLLMLLLLLLIRYAAHSSLLWYAVTMLRVCRLIKHAVFG